MKDDLKDKQDAGEDARLKRLREILPEGIKATTLTDQGLGDTKPFGCLDTLGFDDVIRFRHNPAGHGDDGGAPPAAHWSSARRRTTDACPRGAVCAESGHLVPRPFGDAKTSFGSGSKADHAVHVRL